MSSGHDNEDALALVQAVFAGHHDELGKPDSPTQAGFLALARAGPSVWNAWRAEWPRPEANFGNVDFRAAAAIDFSGFQFGAKANFSHAQFDGWATFINAQFGNDTNFESATFLAANYFGAQFGQWATFALASFDGITRFQGAQFSFNASFYQAKFKHGASFDSTQFKEGLSFDDARFGREVSFQGAQFGGNAIFIAAQFHESVSFNGTQFGDAARFDGARFFDVAQFEAWTRQRVEDYWRRLHDVAAVDTRIKFAADLELRSDAFKSVSFSGAEFAGDVSFQNREFLATSNFGPVVPHVEVGPFQSRVRTILPSGQRTCFRGVPTFHGCKLHQDTSFDKVEFLSLSSPKAARAYRTLKLAMAQQQAIREEQLFFRLEMTAEGASTTGARRSLFILYRALSNYGFSLWRPLLFWVGCLVVFGLIHGALAGPSALHTGIDWQRTMQWVQYVLFNAIPLPGFDKAQFDLRGNLFGRSEGVMLAAIALDMLHKTCVLIAVFLAALALRNLFKMKG